MSKQINSATERAILREAEDLVERKYIQGMWLGIPNEDPEDAEYEPFCDLSDPLTTGHEIPEELVFTNDPECRVCGQGAVHLAARRVLKDTDMSPREQTWVADRLISQLEADARSGEDPTGGIVHHNDAIASNEMHPGRYMKKHLRKLAVKAGILEEEK